MGRYTSEAAVAQRLAVLLDAQGGGFTDAQAAECADLIDAAEDWLDRWPGGPWATTTAITGERHLAHAASNPATGLTAGAGLIGGPVTPGASAAVRLYVRPVDSIEEVRLRAPSVGATSAVLVDGQQYELLDAANGVLLVSAADGLLVEVDYTPAASAPPVIRRAATELVAAWLQPSMGGLTLGSGAELQSYSVGQEVQVRFNSRTTQSHDGQTLLIPDLVMTLLESLGPQLVFA